ncbi:uncharacterized protein LOC118197317 [Stegodyphus dumicola]|uniref:uncharacterized protein LOC118197317 n=1 Tax=Stegodyphus dumicola TaxID=202533 RepID=UPI0015B21EB1|nr:uncharacterized protein LOC118197317 [Stegodyphus dumicola]
MQCPANLFQLTGNLNNRQSLVILNNTVVSKQQTRGCPQGSCMSADLWNITFNHIVDHHWPIHTKIVAFADDVEFVVNGSTRDHLQNNCNATLQIFNNLCQNIKLQISHTKSQAIIFHKPGRTITRNPIITIGNNKIKCVKTVKYLGLTIDQKLNWLEHLRNKRIVTNQIAQSIKRMRGYNWGLNARIMKLLLTTVINPIINYASAIWARPMTCRKEKLLNSIQRPFLLNISRAFSTTSTNALQVITGTMSLPIAAETEAIWNTVLQLQRTASFQDTTCIPEEYKAIARKYKHHPANHLHNLICNIKNTPPTTSYTAYTDGSKIDAKVRAAATLHTSTGAETTWQGHLRQHNSVYQAELTAIQHAIDLFTNIPTDNVHIISDSQASIQAILNEDNCSPIAQNIRDKIRNDRRHFTISWTKGHSTSEGNNRADELAKQAAQDQAGSNIHTPWPRSHLKQQLRQIALHAWQQQWDNQTQGRRTYRIAPQVSEDRLITKYYITQFTTGHGPFPTYFKARNLAQTDTCVCGTTGSPEHYLFHCHLTATMHPTNYGIEFIRFIIKHKFSFYKFRKSSITSTKQDLSYAAHKEQIKKEIAIINAHQQKSSKHP